jgi:hypothetical protein
MKLLDVNHPFFLPRWRRVALVAFLAAWALLEWAAMSLFWAIIVSALAVYAWYALLLTFDPAKAAGDQAKPKE